MTLIISVIVGVLVSAISLSNHINEQKQNALNLAQEILTVAEGGATNAAWTLDPALANQVIGSVTALGIVEDVLLIEERGNILAQSKSPDNEVGPLNQWILQHVINEEIRAERELFVQVSNMKRKVGELSIKLDRTEHSQDLLNVAKSVILTGLVQALIIALLLLWLSSVLITSPLRRVAACISKIAPENPNPLALARLRIYPKNELGQLVRHIEAMLQGLIKAQVQLRHLATRDPLTDKLNRTLIADRLSQAIIKAKRTETKVAVLFIDMDRFKNINDSLGHDIGDILLIEVANRIMNVLRGNDSVGRLGGDEFLIVMEDNTDLNEIVSAVQRVDETLSHPYFLQEHEIRTSGSIGISIYPDNGHDASELIRCADLAMYEAKASNTHWHFFAKEMSDKVEARLKIEAALNYAVERQEFHLNYQPKLSSKSGKMVGCEALIRWDSNPAAITVEGFIKIAEESGSIIAIGDWVLETACQQIKRWEKYYGSISISVNVSARQMHEENYVERVLSILKKYDVNPKLIDLEITETVLMRALDESFMVLTQLREHGIGISIDDFGTGYCSLSYLSRLPVDTLKIDRSFVSGEQPFTAVLEMIVAMAKALGLKTVAEGVETTEQKEWLIQQGCDFLQGYLISKPIPSNEFEERFLINQSKVN